MSALPLSWGQGYSYAAKQLIIRQSLSILWGVIKTVIGVILQEEFSVPISPVEDCSWLNDYESNESQQHFVAEYDLIPINCITLIELLI